LEHKNTNPFLSLPLIKKNENLGDVVTLRNVFGTTLLKKIGKMLNNVVTKLEYKKGLFFYIYI